MKTLMRRMQGMTLSNRGRQVLLVGLAVMSVVLGASACADEPLRLKVLSYNIHHAEGVDGKLDLERIADIIITSKADVVALQEVDQNAKRSKAVDQPTELARLTNMNVVFGPNIPLQGGKYGNAVLSKYPIISHTNHLLPNLDNGEQRGALVAEIELPDASQSLMFIATHFDHRTKDLERIESARVVNRLAAEFSRHPTLLAGDLNDVRGSATLDVLQSAWQHTSNTPTPTIPVDIPTRQIDFILTRPAKLWRTVDVQVLNASTASDHRPILATLELQRLDAE